MTAQCQSPMIHVIVPSKGKKSEKKGAGARTGLPFVTQLSHMIGIIQPRI